MRSVGLTHERSVYNVINGFFNDEVIERENCLDEIIHGLVLGNYM